MGEIGYRMVYSTINCSKSKLNQEMLSSERQARSNSYFHCPKVELVTFEKIGFRSYLAVWKVSGVPKETVKPSDSKRWEEGRV